MISLKKLTKASFILSLLLPLVFGSLSVHARVLDKVAAKVNSEIITLSAIEERAELLRQKYVGAPISISEQDLLKDALNMIIEERLQIQEGKKYGFIVDEYAIDAAVEDIKKKNNLADGQLQEMLKREGRTLESYKNHIRDQILVSKITQFEIGNRVKVSEKSIIKYYKKNQKEFWEEGKVRTRHILFISERGSSENRRRAKLRQAKKVLSEIRKGSDFSKLAIKYSEDVSASSGGDVGFVKRGKMVREFEEAVFSLKPGQISDIVETEYGYHIIKVDEVLPGKTLTLKDVKNRIHKILSMQKQKQVYDDWINELKKSAFIEVTLFDEPAKNKSMVSRDFEIEKTNGKDKRKKKLRSKNHSRQQALQKKWEAMYKSVEKSKENSKQDEDSEFGSLEQKLKHIKQLRDQNKISEQEYQKRKEKLLNRL
jgi:peptidyl-prolyl cis-trans isomerase SurA|tara:strand:- start:1010 stop:2290 length:1281 start_codon:yes stop_codon:yes gene_type:complete